MYRFIVGFVLVVLGVVTTGIFQGTRYDKLGVRAGIIMVIIGALLYISSFKF